MLLATIGVICSSRAGAQVQLLNLEDAQVGTQMRSSTAPDGFSGFSTSTRLCIVNTAGRPVVLTFANSHGQAPWDGRSWLARHLQSGALTHYRQIIYPPGSPSGINVSDPAQRSITLPPDQTAATRSDCARRFIRKESVFPDTRNPGLYSDLVTVTATLVQ